MLFDRSDKVRIEVLADRLAVRGDLFGAGSTFNLDEAVVVDLEKDRDLRPRWKLMGTALPGYYSGWFSLRNRSRVMVFLSDFRQVLALPGKDGRWLLLNCADPQGLLSLLREQGTKDLFE